MTFMFLLVAAVRWYSPGTSFIRMADGTFADCPRIVLDRYILHVVICKSRRIEPMRRTVTGRTKAHLGFAAEEGPEDIRKAVGAAFSMVPVARRALRKC